MTAGTGGSLVESVSAFAASIRPHAAEIERSRRIPAELVARLTELGVFRLAAPRSAGGLEADPLTLCSILHDLGRANGSVGWVAMIGASTSVATGLISEPAATELLADPTFLLAGSAAPMGRARVVDGGFRVTGRWPFVSASHHANWLVAGCVVADEAGPVTDPAGRPVVKHLIVRADEVVLHDTWDVVGLRGTGSDDMELSDVFVPDERVFSLFNPEPPRSGPLYAFPVFGLLAIGIGAVALGIGRAAVDEIVRLAGVKPVPGRFGTIAAKPATRTSVAQAEGLLDGGWQQLRGAVDECWQTVLAGRPVSVTQRARLRLAVLIATTSAATAVDLAYHAGGGTSVYTGSPLQQCFRDVHMATQHAMVGSDVLELCGAVLLSEPVDTSRL